MTDSAQNFLAARKKEIFRSYQSDSQLYNMLFNQVCIDNVSAWNWKNTEEKITIWRQIIPAYQDYQLDKLLEKNSNVLDPEVLDSNIRHDLRKILEMPPSEYERESLKQLGIRISSILKLEKFIIASQDYIRWYNRFEDEKKKFTDFTNKPQPTQPTSTKMIPQEIPAPVSTPTVPVYIPPKPKDTSSLIHVSEQQKKLYQRTKKINLKKEVTARLASFEKSGFKDTPILEKELLQILLNLVTNDDYEYPTEELRKKLNSHNRLNNSAIIDRISHIESQTDSIRSYQDIVSLLSILEPINIWKLMEKYLSSKFQSISKALYVLGLTGAGKTTFILWMLGYEFVTKKGYGISYFEPIGIKPEHCQLVTSISPTSVTSKLATFPLDNKISIVDTTGDLDTQGVETELANQLMITNSYKHCEGIAYLMLQELAPLQGTRCQKMVDLAKRIAERFNYKDGNQLESFLIMVFNNKNHWDDNRIRELIKNAQKIIQQQSGKFKQLYLSQRELIALQFIIQSLKKKLFLDIGNDDERKKILKEIKKLSYGKNQMCFSLEDSTKTKVAECAKVLRDNVEFYLEKKQIDAASFYYEELNQLHKLMKDIIDSQKISLDDIIIKKSEQQYNLFADILKQAVDNQLITPESLRDLDEAFKELQFYSKLAKLNPKIKSSKDVKPILDKQTQRIIDMVKGKCSKDKIQSLTNLCLEIYKRFEEEVKAFSKSIEQVCCKKMKSLDVELSKKWKENEYGGLDEAIEQYQIYELFYTYFEKTSVVPFCFQKQKLRRKADIVQDFQSKITQRIEKAKEALAFLEAACRENQKIEEKNIKYLNQKSELFSSVKLVKALEFEHIITNFEKEVKEKLKSINDFFSNSIESLFDFSDNFQSRIQICTITRKNYEYLCQRLNTYDSQQEFKQQMGEMHNKIKLLRQKWRESIEEIKKTVERKEILPEKYKIQSQIKIKAAAFDSVTEDQTQNLSDLISSFFTEFNLFYDAVSRTLSEKKLFEFTKQEMQRLLKDINIVSSYKGLDSNCEAKITALIDRMRVQVKECCALYSKSVLGTHLENLKDVEKFISTSLYDRWNRYYQNLLAPSESLGFFTPFIESHKAVYQTIFDTFVAIEQTCIKANKDKIKGKLTVLDNKEAEIVKIITIVYKWIDKIKKNAELYSFINNKKSRYGSHLSLEIETNQENIRQMVNEKANQIKMMKIRQQTQKANLVNLFNLKKQCDHWSYLCKIVNDDVNDKDGAQQFMKICQQLDNQINEASGKLQGSISTLLDPQTNLLKEYNFIRCEKLYRQYKNTLQSGMDLQNSFSQLIEQIQTGVQQQIKLLNDASAESNSAFDKELYLKMRQTIQLYEMLDRLIDASDRETYSINFFNYLKQCIEEKIQTYQEEIDNKFSIMQSLINSHEFKTYQSEAKQIKKFIVLIKNYFQTNNSNNRQNHNQVKLAELDQKKKIVEASEKLIIQDPFTKANIQKLRTIYEKANQSEKAFLRTKIRNKFEELIYDYQLCTWNADSKANDLRQWVIMIPSQIVSLYRFEQRIREEENRRKAELDEEIAQLSNFSLPVLSEKYEKYVSMRSSLPGRDCLKHITLKIEAELKRSEDIPSIVDKIKIYRDSIWAVKLNTDSREKVLLKQMLEDKERHVSQIIKVYAEGKFQQITEILEQIQPFSLEVRVIINEIQQIGTSLKSVRAQNLVTEDFIKASFQTLFEEKTSLYASQFYRYCPLNNFVKMIEAQNTNLESLQKTLLRCLKSLHVYTCLLEILPNNNFEAEAGEEMVPIETEDRPSRYYLSKKQLDIFKRLQLYERKRLLKQSIETFEFSDANNCNLTKTGLTEKLMGINKSILILSIFEKVQAAFNNSPPSEQGLLSKTVLAFQDKLFKFIKQIKLKFERSLAKAEENMPLQFAFLQNLLDILSSSDMIILKMFKRAEEDEQRTTVRSRPSEYLSKMIEKKVTWFQNSLKNSRERLMGLKNDQKRLELLKAVESNYKSEMNRLASQKQQRLKQAVEGNIGKSEQEKRSNLQELSNFFINQQKNKIEEYNKLKSDIMAQSEVKEKQQLNFYTSFLYTTSKLSFQLSEVYQISKTNCENILKQELENLERESFLSKVSSALDELGGDYGHLLKQTYPNFFRREVHQIWIQKTQAQDLKYVLASLCTRFDKISRKGDSINKKKLEVECYKCAEKFNQIRNEFKSSTKNGLSNIVKSYDKTSLKEEKIAIILAVWSIIDNEIVQLKPHPVQIAALMLLAQTEGESIIPKMAEVLTGEGKSIILATLSCFFAKKGYKVSVACYAEHLSKRDYANFTRLFTYFEVKDSIFYGTFNEICEKVLNSEKQTFKQMIYKLFVKKTFLDKIKATISDGFFNFFSKNENKKMILLVDQFDVFFDKEYCGELFRPQLTLNDKCSKNLIYSVWEKVKKNPNLMPKEIEESVEFKELVAEYPQLKSIFQNQIHGMVKAAKSPDHPHIIKDRCLMYQDKEKITDKLSYGFQTVYLNCLKKDQNLVSQGNLDKALNIPLIVGEFLYTMLPSYFDSIIGISGTINTLSKEKFKLLKEFYKIEDKYTYLLPSIYGKTHKNKCNFDLCSPESFYSKIIRNAVAEISKGRPVIICFSTYKHLRDFRESKEFKDSKIICNFIHELQNQYERDKSIKSACFSGILTLMTSTFSRGTDFVVLDHKVRNAGGLHLILVYIPECEAQFVQFLGRTQRQGENGSVTMIVNSALWPSSSHIPKDNSEVKDMLDIYWQGLDEKQTQIKKENIARNLPKHEKTIKCLRDVQNNIEELVGLITELNFYQPVQNTTIKAILGLDGTISMDAPLKKIIEVLKNVMVRMKDIQKEKKIAGEVELQIIIYRNYNSGSKILQKSNFEKDFEKLISFLQTVEVSGGMGREAIETLYQALNRTPDVNMLFLIGDAPPNYPNEVSNHRGCKQWKDFEKTELSKKMNITQTNSAVEEAKFSPDLVVNSMYVTNTGGNNLSRQTKQYFTRIAKSHKGEADELNFKQKNVGDRLTQFFTTKILLSLAGSSKKDEIEEFYQSRYRAYS